MARPAAPKFNSLPLFAAIAGTALLGACAQDTGDALQTSLISGDSARPQLAKGDPDAGKTELEKATDYWGKKFKEHPSNLEAALSYIKNLRAMGERQKALAVIQQVSIYHGSDKQFASEYGRLALELDQLSVAKQMLAIADDPSSPDWRVISARGTVLSKEGKFREAIGFYERALSLSQEQTSVMNNLAMAYAMNGEAARAEEMLRKIESKGGSQKSRQNLALVLSLQGKFDEAKQISATELGPEGAAADSELLRRMVKVEKGSGWTTTSSPAGSGKTAAAPLSTAIAAPSVTPAATPAVATEGPTQWMPANAAAALAPQGPVLKGMTP